MVKPKAIATIPSGRGLCSFVVFGALLSVHSVQADIAVIVNASNPVQSLTAKQVAELYLGRTRTFESGQHAIVIDQGLDDPVRRRFFKDISGLSIGQVNAFWSRLKFTGQMQAPKSVDGDSAVLEWVRSTPTAIGYVSAIASSDPKVKTVLVLHEQVAAN